MNTIENKIELIKKAIEEKTGLISSSVKIIGRNITFYWHDKEHGVNVFEEISEQFLNFLPLSSDSVSKETLPNSTQIIGNVHERYKELESYKFDWHSFYHGWIEGRALLAYGKETPAPGPDFIEYMRQARNEFVKKVWEIWPDAKERVIAENLLICFDQMREKIKATSAPDEWISVKERFPEIGQAVLAYIDNGTITMAYRTKSVSIKPGFSKEFSWQLFGDVLTEFEIPEYAQIAYWKPLPPAHNK
jgi:hypothetical protein